MKAEISGNTIISGNRWQQVVLYITILGMAGCWFYTLLYLVNELAVEGALHTLGILLFLPLSFVLNKAIQMLRLHRLIIYVISGLLWLLFMLLAVKIEVFPEVAWFDASWLAAVPASIVKVIWEFRPELLILISSAALWWMGWHYASRKADFSLTFRDLQFGLVLLLIGLFSSHLKGLDDGSLIVVTFAFFCFSLLSVAVAHGREGTGWLTSLQRRHWMGLLLIAIAVILILGLVIGAIITPDLLQIIVDALKWIWNQITKALLFLISLLPEPKSNLENLPPTPTVPDPEAARESQLLKLPESVREILNIIYVVMVIGFVLLALWRLSAQLISWLGRRLAHMSGVEAEPIRGAFKEDLASLLVLLKNTILKLLRFLFPFLRPTGKSEVLPEAASVRQLYRQVLGWAADGGYPRGLSQTPNDFFNTLVQLVPEAHVDLQLITHYYVNARYGTFLPTDNEIHQMKQSWKRVQQNQLKSIQTSDKSEQEENFHE
jgi:hypothetical protein